MHMYIYTVYIYNNIYIYPDPPRVSNFSLQVCFWWLRGPNFRPLEDFGVYIYNVLKMNCQFLLGLPISEDLCFGILQHPMIVAF